MRQHLELWIDGVSADLDEKTTINFNYTMEDLTNPAIVKYSFTQPLTLKGTSTNNRIFSHIYRPDRLTRSGFNPQTQTPFILTYNRHLLERGFLELDKVEHNGSDITYTITLYGGLGSFFYALSYRADGEKKTLADLDYFGDGSELYYDCYAEQVSDAWAALGKSYDRTKKWHHINFAPCYNGIPSEGFSADKAVMLFSDHAPYPDNMSNNGVGQYQPAHFIQLSQEYDEWATRDLRAYMQRPVVRMRSIFEAIKDTAQNGGFNVELDESFFYSQNPYYADAWITRPLVNSLELSNVSGVADVSIQTAPQLSSASNPASVRVNVFVGNATNIETRGTISAYVHITLENSEGLSVGDTFDLRSYYGEYQLLEYTLRAFSFDGEEIYGDTADASMLTFRWDGREAVSTSRVAFNLTRTTGVGWFEIQGQLIGDFTLRSTESQSEAYNIATIYLGESGSNVSYEGSTSVRSGARITQNDILKTEGTPADYLLSYCKMFGLHFILDKLTNTIRIATRNTLYGEAQTLNIESRIDRSKKMTTTPFVFDARLYDFGVENTEGAYAEYYKGVYGRDYGTHRVNTGYAFDSSNKNVMESVIFKGAAEVMARGRYFNRIEQGGKKIPSVFLDSGHKVTYVNVNNSSESFDYDIPSVNRSATITYINDEYKSYDSQSRLQFCDEEDKPVDGEDVLVIYRKKEAYNAILSDDEVALFNKYNEGTPCWLLQAFTNTIQLPLFSRYSFNGSTIAASLDFGVPAEIDIPGISHGNGATIYERGWAEYLADRYNVDSKVVTCNVDWRGIQVGENLLRNFYYFDGAVWVLNKIINHSLTSYNTTQCEFVKVQNVTNYQYGQNYDI